MTERIALLVAQLNNCDYCVSARTFRGPKIGISAEDFNATRLAKSENAKSGAALNFVSALVQGHGMVDQQVNGEMQEQGWDEEEIGEIISHVALNVFSNYFKKIAHPELDFPVAPELIR